MEEGFTEKYVEVPAESISAEALNALIESFVLREGTDYGDFEYNLEQKVNHVRKQLSSGEVAIVFNLELQSADIDSAGTSTYFSVNPSSTAIYSPRAKTHNTPP